MADKNQRPKEQTGEKSNTREKIAKGKREKVVQGYKITERFDLRGLISVLVVCKTKLLITVDQTLSLSLSEAFCEIIDLCL